MLTSSSYGAISAVAPTKIYRASKEREPRVRTTGETHNKYDSVSFSASTSEENKFRAMVGRLTQEVRTATTTGDIQNLRNQVASGRYAPDPMAIAKRMLLLGGDG